MLTGCCMQRETHYPLWSPANNSYYARTRLDVVKVVIKLLDWRFIPLTHVQIAPKPMDYTTGYGRTGLVR